MTTKDEILRIVPPVDSSLQGAPPKSATNVQQSATNVQTAALQQQQQEHSNGGVEPASGNTATLTQQQGTESPVQTGANVVQQPVASSNESKVATTSVQGDVAKVEAAKMETPAEGVSVTQQQSAPAGEVKKPMTYVEMYQQLSGYTPPTKEELEKERKKQKRKAIFAAIGDGVSALANIYFAGQYGTPNMFDPKNTMSGKLKAQWDKEDAERKANASKYLSGYMNAMKMDGDEAKDARNWAHQLEREKVADKRADDQMEFQKGRAAKQDEQWQKSFDRQGEQWNKDFEFKQKSFKESVRQFNVTSSQNAQRIRMESQRLAHQIKNDGGVTFTLGKGKDVHISKDRLNSQTVSYVFSQLPEEEKKKVQGPEIMTMQYGQKVGTGQHEQPSTEAMLVAIGMNASNPKVATALREISGSGKKMQFEGDESDLQLK